MLVIDVVLSENFNDKTQQFVDETFRLELEHSLVSLSKWESKHEKPFLTTEEKTPEETLSYIHAMVLTEDVPSEVYGLLSKTNLEAINEYINAKMSATWFNEPKNSPSSGETITAELIYYWLVALQIPFETQHWHLNRLMTLVKVCNYKNQPAKKPGKMTRQDLNQRAAINARRREELQSNG